MCTTPAFCWVEDFSKKRKTIEVGSVDNSSLASTQERVFHCQTDLVHECLSGVCSTGDGHQAKMYGDDEQEK